ncbi:hypothetical protein K439DRAFT_1348278 [Ramaria rubella]|nr:hypothetical protein K439DRAFT_1348278 [Ramaria rubella]
MIRLLANFAVFLYVIIYSHLASANVATSILYPLYIDPGGLSCAAWQPLINATATQPDLPFYIIVNPDSGPGSATPTAGYQTCIPSLRANSNVKVIGYVATGEGASRSQADVEGDVDLYAAWGSAYRPDGVFFDQAATSSQEVSVYETYRSYVATKAWFTSDESFVTLNPGTTPDAGYYAVADLIVTFEDTYASFQFTDLTISTTTPASKQAVILHTAPSGSHASTIEELVSGGVAAIYITNIADDSATDFNPYSGFPVDWTEFVSAVADAE